MFHRFIGGQKVKHTIPKVPMLQAQVIPTPSVLTVPLSMHIGKPASPLVNVGDAVKLGQPIGEAMGLVSSFIHAPVSGKVIAIEPRLINVGTRAMSIIIENDGLDTPYEMIRPHLEAEGDPEALVSVIRDAGIVGMGGATFPTAFKISSGWGKVNTLVINGAECEPSIASDYRAMLDSPKELLHGIELLLCACKAEKAVLVIENNKPEAIDTLSILLPKDGRISLLSVPVRYPQGAEKQLVYTVTGREISPGGLPASVGCAVFNVETCLAVENAVRTGMPLIERYCTVGGDAVNEPKVVKIRVGYPVDYILEAAGGLKQEPDKVIMGGPMMGFALYDLSIPCNKGTNGLIAFLKDQSQSDESKQCIRCGRCISACPMRLLPSYLYMFTNKDAVEKLDSYHIMDCIECGCCSYGCPAKLPLTQTFKLGKSKLRNYQTKQKEGK